MNPALVAIQMGHTDLRTLMKTYLHSDHEAMRKALDEGRGILFIADAPPFLCLPREMHSLRQVLILCRPIV